ncbi:energy-coupling factor transporter ATPase [Thermophilibacter sp. ET337]|uniref:ABC transporter ATP-binding protein n=1 Tax=Thermophilibacter sp. ET337 TaxID=2973084 RepID=UPI0021AC5DC3|nr:energy-coupling factor transporter ATPase [Thermophilibacter sp. ET337]MCR8907818.1 energy-coupling factor transporter ATPase [Thermophilibacter sp. ET337]
MAQPSPIIRLDDVSFSYGASATPALDHVSLCIAPGEFVGVIGPSGAGKSTLAAALSGAIPHHYRGQLFGAVTVDGSDTCEVTLTDISRVVGSINQDIDAQMVASVVEDELLFGLENFGVPHDQIPDRLASALETVGIADLREREIATLSGGQKQKVAIAAMLALRPRVLVLDEPTAALDPVSSSTVFETLRALNRDAGITVVVIEQKVALLCEHCDRIVVMDRGRVAFDGTPRSVFSHGRNLRALGVDSPRVARISNSLAEHGVIEPGAPCLSVAEARDLVADLVRGQAAGEKNAAAGIPAKPRTALPADPVVSFRDVSFAYPGSRATVEHLSFDARPGEIVGVVGQNGAGKTTLTKLLNGLLKPASGEVLVAGLDTRDTPTSRLAAHVSTLFQNPDRQLCKDTVLDEVAFGLELTGVGAGEARERARSVAERFGLPLDAAPFSLSRGQRQMVALASVVVMEPEVVLLDEPTSGLDYRECMTVMETVREMAEKGCAVVMVCHDMEVVSDFAERVIVMADGRILGQGPADQVFADAGLMARADVEAPQVVRLAAELARDVSPAFAGASQVSDIVDTVEGMLK